MRTPPFTLRHLGGSTIDAYVDAIVELSLTAWAPVFTSLERSLGPPVFRLIYPDWAVAQAAAVRTVCTAPENEVWVAVTDNRLIGFVAIGFVDEDAARAGEIIMIAADPRHQRGGVGTALMRRALAEVEARGVDLAIVATGGDPGHAPARALYERFGFTPLPQVRYYRTVGPGPAGTRPTSAPPIPNRPSNASR